MKKQDIEDKSLLFADLDGTLIKTASGKTFPINTADFVIRQDVLTVLQKLTNLRHLFIVTNQGGIESGFYTTEQIRLKLDAITNLLYANLPNCHVGWMFCPTNNKKDDNRKPNVGMLTELSRSAKLTNKFAMFMIGDASGKPGQFSDSDKKTAENFGIDYIDVEDFVKTFEQ